eukprot:5689276-Pleurochrysis_carterae.AAC.1
MSSRFVCAENATPPCCAASSRNMRGSQQTLVRCSSSSAGAIPSGGFCASWQMEYTSVPSAVPTASMSPTQHTLRNKVRTDHGNGVKQVRKYHKYHET